MYVSISSSYQDTETFPHLSVFKGDTDLSVSLDFSDEQIQLFARFYITLEKALRGK